MISQKKQTIIALICAVLAVAAVFAYTATVSSEAEVQRKNSIKNMVVKSLKSVLRART